jgi:hypothetical protein
VAAVHDISLSSNNGSAVAGAVALSLSAPSRRSRVDPADGWNVELREGRDFVVVRTTASLPLDDLIDGAIDHAHRALDLTSVEDGNHLATISPATNHIVFSRPGGRPTVRCQSLSDLTFDMTVETEVRDGAGNLKPQPARPALPWSPAFRFHRLSQVSRDLYSAYRNTFLALEALLDGLFPKRGREGEKAWLVRAVAAASARVDITRLANSGVSDPVREVVDRLYTVRVSLFHAKTGRAIIPDERISYLSVSEAYATLVALWAEIARAWLPLQLGSAVVTYVGFRAMMTASLADARIGLTADMSAASKTDSALSPQGLPVFVLPDPPTLSEVRPGLLAVRGRVETTLLPTGQTVGRIGVLVADTGPFVVNSVTGGLTLDGVDVFETVTMIRLINRGSSNVQYF